MIGRSQGLSRQELEMLAEGRPLSPMEKECLTLAAEGLTNTEIGSRLYIAEGTVKQHLTHARAKLKANNKPHAVALAIRGGLI